MVKYPTSARGIIERCYYFAKEDAATELWSERALEYVSGVIERVVADELRAMEATFTAQANVVCNEAQELVESTARLVGEYAKLRESHGELIHVATTHHQKSIALEKAALAKTFRGRIATLRTALRNLVNSFLGIKA